MNMNPCTYCIISKSNHREFKKGADDQTNITDFFNYLQN